MNAHSALQKSILLLQFSLFPVSPQDAGFLLAYKSGFCHHTDKSLLSFNSNCIIP